MGLLISGLSLFLNRTVEQEEKHTCIYITLRCPEVLTILSLSVNIVAQRIPKSY